jgi:hypothetical protein
LLCRYYTRNSRNKRERRGETKQKPLNREVAPGTILIQPTHPRTLYYTRLYAQESHTYTHTRASLIYFDLSNRN